MDERTSKRGYFSHSGCWLQPRNTERVCSGICTAIILQALYIFWFLHKTTTGATAIASHQGCISFDSYIKPQRRSCKRREICVVYLLIPTSNHNLITEAKYADMLYIFWFLHQTTTGGVADQTCKGCISFDSYIKPQQLTEHKKKC